jgi:S-formylglutathione hydrolase FrmB
MWIQLNFFSKALGMNVPVNVLLPSSGVSQRDLPVRPVLWLLHGAYGNQDDWIRRTAIERYAQEYDLAVVMPAAHLSGYADMAHGGAFYTYISKELPKMMRAFFPLSSKREENFIAGLPLRRHGRPQRHRGG